MRRIKYWFAVTRLLFRIGYKILGSLAKYFKNIPKIFMDGYRRGRDGRLK